MAETTEINQQKEMEKAQQVAQEQVAAINGAAPSEQPMTVFTGRQKIYTDYINSNQLSPSMNGCIVLSEDNMHDALTKAMKVHVDNAREIEYLLDYAKGKQNILNRQKETRSDVNNRVVINYAESFTRDIIGYTFGKPMQYTIRRGEDNVKDELKLISDYTEVANKSVSDNKKATTASICGISHRGVFKNPDYNEDNEDESPFTYMDLDPKNTFVAYSSQIGNKEVFACTYITGQDENNENYTLYTVYTTDKVYQYKTNGFSNTIMKDNLVKGYPQPNPLGICIVENENNQFRMGHWETGITLMDAINKIASDSVNDIEQFVDAILVAVNAEFTEEMVQTVRDEHYAEIKSPMGLNADLKYIQGQLDGASVEQTRQYLEACLRVVVGIPDRKSRGGGGGDTGDAVKLRDGWADMEVVARNTDTFNKVSEKKELKVILKILRAENLIKNISMLNVDMKYPRNKTDNIVSKAQAISTLYNTKIMAPEDVLEIGDITTDVADVVARGTKYWKQKAEEGFEEQKRQLELRGVEDVTQEGVGNANNKSNTDNTNNTDNRTKSAEPTGSDK